MEDKLNRVTFFFGGAVDSYWHAFVDFLAPARRLKFRLHQKMYLARFASIDPFTWENRETAELDEHYVALSEIMSDHPRVTEDD